MTDENRASPYQRLDDWARQIGIYLDGTCSPGEMPRLRAMLAEMRREAQEEATGQTTTPDETARLRQQVAKLRRELTSQRWNNERRSRQLDALGVVWCSGGCSGGMLRYEPDREVTAEMVAALVVNADRAMDWYVNHAGKAAARGERSRAWERANARLRAAIAAALAGDGEADDLARSG